MTDGNPTPTTHCPNCRAPMQAQEVEQNYRGSVRVDVCFTCSGIWFDRMESTQLAPAAVIEMFKEIHSHLDDARQPLANRLGCPRCGDALALSSDLCKSGPFTYFRCPRGDGRFTPFFQFLREKQFVRSLTPAELQRIRSQVRQIRCSECGAPIDLEHSSQCKYCHAPVSFLDPEAVEKALSMWSDADNRRRLAPTAQAVGEAMQRIQLPRTGQSDSAMHLISHLLSGANTSDSVDLGLDLVATGIRAIGRLIHGER